MNSGNFFQSSREMSLKEVDTSSTCIFICQLNLWARKCQNFTLPSLSDIYQTHLSCESCFHHMFENWDSNVFSLSYHYSPVLIPDIISGIPKLRRVLLAYSIHNPETEYCQVGLILLFLPQRFAQKLCKCSSSSFANIIQATVQVFLQILFKQVLLQVLLKQVLLKYCIVANIVEASTLTNIVESSCKNEKYIHKEIGRGVTDKMFGDKPKLGLLHLLVISAVDFVYSWLFCQNGLPTCSPLVSDSPL